MGPASEMVGTLSTSLGQRIDFRRERKERAESLPFNAVFDLPFFPLLALTGHRGNSRPPEGSDFARSASDRRQIARPSHVFVHRSISYSAKACGLSLTCVNEALNRPAPPRPVHVSPSP